MIGWSRAVLHICDTYWRRSECVWQGQLRPSGARRLQQSTQTQTAWSGWESQEIVVVEGQRRTHTCAHRRWLRLQLGRWYVYFTLLPLDVGLHEILISGLIRDLLTSLCKTLCTLNYHKNKIISEHGKIELLNKFPLNLKKLYKLVLMYVL